MIVEPELSNPKRANPKPVTSYPLISDWIKFNTDNTVTVYSGRVELGQGVNQAFTLIAAQALYLNTHQILLVSGDTELCPNEGYTAGSLSIGEGGMSIRVAAMAASSLFRLAVANQLSCDPQNISIREGAFFHGDSKTDHSYWTKASTLNLAVSIPASSLTHDDECNKFESQSYSKNSLHNILSGTTYIHDIELSSLLHARVFLPPHPNAQLNVSNEELSERLPNGVRLLRINQFIALVSDDEWAVEKTIKQLEDIYEHLWQWSKDSSLNGNQIDTLDLLPTKDTLVFSQDNSLTSANSGTAVTDREQAISVSIARPCLLHASIGPSCALALFSDSQLTVWTHSQGVFPLRRAIASVLNMDECLIRVIHTPGSGCYGHNGADDAAEDAAIIAHQFPNKAIRLLYSRKNECQHGTLGPAMRTRATASLSAAGKLYSFTIEVTSPPHSSRPRGKDVPNVRAAALLKNEPVRDIYQPYSFSDPPLPAGGAERNAIPGYDVDVIQATHHTITKLPYRASSIRSLGAFTNVMAIESLMDECADYSNINPIVFRLNHLKDIRAVAVIKKVVQQSAWNGTETGFGLAYARYKNSAAYCACVVKLIVDEEIIVQNIWMSVDVGEVINAEGVKAQIEGGAVQAVSWTLLEQAHLIDGKVGVTGWQDYPILGFAQVPVIDVEILPRPTMPALGCGEASQGPVGAAILNATRSVLDFRPIRLPLTRESLIDQIELVS